MDGIAQGKQTKSRGQRQEYLFLIFQTKTASQFLQPKIIWIFVRK